MGEIALTNKKRKEVRKMLHKKIIGHFLFVVGCVILYLVMPATILTIPRSLPDLLVAVIFLVEIISGAYSIGYGSKLAEGTGLWPFVL
jgi:hypothetical protein